MKLHQIFSTSFAALSLIVPQLASAACIPGFVMESRPTRENDDWGYPRNDRVQPQEFHNYSWNSPRIALTGEPNLNFGMFLYVPGLGDYVRSYDWSYCTETREIVFHRTPATTRYYNRYVYDGYGIWVQYAD